MATHELLENAVKYSLDGTTNIRIEIELVDGAYTVRVCTKNHAAPDHLASVLAIVDGIAAAKDAFSYYQAAMRASAKRAEGSGLGLARICAEGEMTMRYELSGDELTLIASARLDLPEAS
jgi:hypothetical protein